MGRWWSHPEQADLRVANIQKKKPLSLYICTSLCCICAVKSEGVEFKPEGLLHDNMLLSSPQGGLFFSFSLQGSVSLVTPHFIAASCFFFL